MTKRKQELKKKLINAGIWFLCGIVGYIVSGAVVPELILTGVNYKLLDFIKIVADITYIVGCLVGVCKAVKALHDTK